MEKLKKEEKMIQKTMKEMQQEIDVWINSFEIGYFSPLSMMAALTEEIGEVARVMNQMYGDKPKKTEETEKNLEEELGDALFSLICIANREKISLNNAYLKKIEKLHIRDDKRFKKKEE